MGQPLEYPGIVNIVTLIVFFVYLVISLYLILSRGLGRSWPWIWLTTLCVCRLVQVSMDLATTQLTPIEQVPNTSVSSGVAILTSMGLTPLFMSTSSLLNTTTKPKGRRMQWILLFVHIPLVISFILIVAGGIDPDSRDGPTYAATEATKAGISLYIVCFLILIWATAVISARLYLADPQEIKILTTVVLSLPFFVVDIVYMTCFAFESWVDKTSDMKFNVISGDVTIQLCMYVQPYRATSRLYVLRPKVFDLADRGVWTVILRPTAHLPYSTFTFPRCTSANTYSQASHHGVHRSWPLLAPWTRASHQSCSTEGANRGGQRDERGSNPRDHPLETSRGNLTRGGSNDHAGSQVLTLDAWKDTPFRVFWADYVNLGSGRRRYLPSTDTYQITIAAWRHCTQERINHARTLLRQQ
jgi:hypothetical protein